jgi:hypothetical protein
MFKKIGTALAAVAMMAGMSVATITPAEAYRGRNVGVGIAAALLERRVLQGSRALLVERSALLREPLRR